MFVKSKSYDAFKSCDRTNMQKYEIIYTYKTGNNIIERTIANPLLGVKVNKSLTISDHLKKKKRH